VDLEIIVSRYAEGLAAVDKLPIAILHLVVPVHRD
jgi:hypothetical protein